MKLKQALLNCLLKDQLKDICAEIEVEADRRSEEAMVAALASSKRAKVKRLIEWMTVEQLKNALELMKLPVGGRKEELVERLLAASAGGSGDVKENAVAEAGKKTDGKGKKGEAKVIRYTFDDVQEPASPETGHTNLLPDELTVTLPMDNGWSRALHVGKLPDSDRPVVVDMDPAADPVLFWAGKRNRRQVPVLPLQRNEVVTESRIAQIIERAQRNAGKEAGQASLFADLEKELRQADEKRRVEFYKHDENWKNKLICGDSLEVMESLMHYEGMRGKVQMIYIDPPYGIDYNANFQQRIDTARNTDDGSADDVLTIRAFRDSWELRVHSYLGALEQRLYLCRELLKESGSVIVQIGDENVHKVRCILDEVFGSENFVSQISFRTKIPLRNTLMAGICDYLLWYTKDKQSVKYRKIYTDRAVGSGTQFTRVHLPDDSRRPMNDEERDDPESLPEGSRIYRLIDLNSSGLTESCVFDVKFDGRTFAPRKGHSWKTNADGMKRLIAEHRVEAPGDSLQYVFYFDDFPYMEVTNLWADTQGASGKRYAVQTSDKVIDRCVLMTTDPGDLVLDITCGSGVTAMSAERWGRRWVTCDVSRVAINIARNALIGAAFPSFELRGNSPGDGFVYDSPTKTTLGSLSNDREAGELVIVDRPRVVTQAVRVAGPFEVMTVGRYSAEDWRGQVVSTDPETGRAALANYITVIAQLYRKGASVETTTGMIHATAEDGTKTIAISVGPITGRVTAKQLNDAVQDALAAGLLEVHVLGWAFEANVGEIKSQLEKRGKVKIELIMIRPDTLAEGLKVTRPDQLFSPLAMPEIEVAKRKDEYTVSLEGVAIFDRKTRSTDYKPAKSGYVSAWYLDQDYDGDCFVDCQMFFDFKKAPNLKAALKIEVDPDEYKLQLESQPFKAGEHRRVAVKVVDVYGNESTVVRDLA